MELSDYVAVDVLFLILLLEKSKGNSGTMNRR